MAGVNKITRSVAPKSLFESAINVITSAVTIAQGDLVIFNDTSNILDLPAAEADGATFLGIARVSISAGKVVSPYQGTAVDASGAIVDVPGPQYGVIAKLVLKTGITIAPGDRVFLDPATGTRGVTNTGTKAIGIYQGPAIAGSAAGQEIECYLGARFPLDSLTF